MVKRLSVLFFLLFFVSNVYALGSMVKNDFAALDENESAKFTILFWGDEEYIELWIEQAPDDWIVIIEPEKFNLNESTGNEYVVLPNQGTRKTFPVDVFVKPTSMLGEQKIIIGARAGNQDQGIAFMQERLFVFTVNSREKGGGITIISNNTEELNQTEEIRIEEPKNQNNYILYLLLILVPIFSIIVYKYS